MFEIDKKNEIILRCFFNEDSVMSEEEKNLFLDSICYIPYKGCGGIQVGLGQVDKAKKLLSDYIGESNFKDYYVESFIQDTGIAECSCYGKMTFPNQSFKEFFYILLDNNITIVNILFQDYDTVFS